VTKGGLKLEFALREFGVKADRLDTADFGCHRGGFTDCLLARGARRVHAVDTGYGILDWKLRNDPRVVVHERKNLLHWNSPEPLDLVVIDAGWTRQHLSVPAALRSLKPGGTILSLVKPQYEAEESERVRGVVPAELLEPIMSRVRSRLEGIVRMAAEARCPFPGSGGNTEVWLCLETNVRKPQAGCGDR